MESEITSELGSMGSNFECDHTRIVTPTDSTAVARWVRHSTVPPSFSTISGHLYVASIYFFECCFIPAYPEWIKPPDMLTSGIVSTSAVQSHTKPARISLSTEYTLENYQRRIRHVNKTKYHANISYIRPLLCAVCYDLHIPRPSRLIPPPS